MRNYKKVSECPPELEKLIEQVNFVPGKFHFPNVREIMNNFYLVQTGYEMPFFDTQGDYSSGKYKTDEERMLHEKALEKTLEIVKEATKSFSKLYNHLFEKPDGMDVAKWYIHTTYVQTPLDAYLEYCKLRRQLRFVARECTAFVRRKSGNTNPVVIPSYETDVSDSFSFRIIKNKINFVPNKIEKLLQGIDARRLRICPICDEVFWAKKTNSETCGEQKCVETLGNRKRSAREKFNKEVKAEKERKRKEKREKIKNQDFSKK